MFLKQLKRKILSHPRFCRVFLISFLIIFVLSILYFLLPPLVKTGTRVILSRDSFTLKNDNNRTNILLLGIGGKEHDGPNLTDTIIVVSVMTKFDTDTLITPPIMLISIPRDIYIESLNNKINAAYDLAGIPLAKELVNKVTGLPIHYAVVVDFSVFERVVDILGGIDVNVPTAFDDNEYPLPGKENDLCDGDLTFKCRYESIHFNAGLQHMTGATALKFVRSRHAQGDEGSDFARSRRQQLVIKAVKDKVFSTKNFLNVGQDLEIYNEIRSKIDTDFDFTQPSPLLTLALRYQTVQFKNTILDETLLYNPPEDYRGWILLPNNNNWEQIHQFIKEQLNPLPEQSAQNP